MKLDEARAALRTLTETASEIVRAQALTLTNALEDGDEDIITAAVEALEADLNNADVTEVKISDTEAVEVGPMLDVLVEGKGRAGGIVKIKGDAPTPPAKPKAQSKREPVRYLITFKNPSDNSTSQGYYGPKLAEIYRKQKEAGERLGRPVKVVSIEPKYR